MATATNTAVIVQSSSQIALADQISFRESKSPKLPGQDVYAKLAASLFETTPKRTVVAFTSVPSGAGVTHVVENLAAILIRSGKSVGICDGALRPLRIAGLPAPVEEFGIRAGIAGNSLAPQMESAAQTVAGLRDRHDCVLLDCGSLESSAGLIRLGPLCDGVVLVAEAGKVSKAQINRAAQSVQRVQGTLLGIVLNKRQYPIPAWLYRLL